MVDRSLDSRGARKRRAILEAATDVATSEGLEGLSLARLADEVGMSKSGVASHFASKEALQLAAVAAAARGYDERVLEPSREAEPGLPRLREMMRLWIEHIDAIPYRGGCFFAAAGHEYATRAGPVRDAIARHTEAWIVALEAETRLAIRLGELRDDVVPRDFAFSLHALVQEANLRRTLFHDAEAFDLARSLATAALDAAAAPS